MSAGLRCGDCRIGQLRMVWRLLLVAADLLGADGSRVPGADVAVKVGQQLPFLFLSSVGRQQLLHL